jgi:ubiquinone/menaquinone biosynthesis C-methylase UbiE
LFYDKIMIMENFLAAVDLSSKLTNQTFDLENIVSQFGLESGMRAADLGSGSGYFTIELAKAVGEQGIVTAIDILEPALDTVRAKATSANLKNIHLVKANLEVLGSTFLAENSQDFVLIKNVLFQNDQKNGIIREAKRILKFGGRLVIIDWEKGAGGLGPPDEYRSSKETILATVSQEGLSFEKDIIIDAYHFGMMFRK